MTTNDAERMTTDVWGRPVLDDGPQLGPLNSDETAWPAVPMLVLSDDDVMTCATEFARAFSSEYFFTVWLIVLDEHGWTTKDAAELLDMPPRPPETGVHSLLGRISTELEERVPGCSVVVAIASPDGGDRSTRELTWAWALLDAARDHGLPVRGVVAVGAHRARLLHTSVPT
ncbi:hypothetical protein AA0Y32_05525 [Georgenia phoenicis]|uniref:hypothetical protein n=1 Tax=unclassified Georgenia TaxID=2626815 RepID=UPI0039AF9894